MDESEKIQYIIRQLAAASVERDRYHKDWALATECITQISLTLASESRCSPNEIILSVKNSILKHHNKSFGGQNDTWEQYIQPYLPM